MFRKTKPETRLQELREKRERTQKDADAEQERLSAYHQKALAEHGRASYEAESTGQEMGQSHWEYSLELEWFDDAILVEEIKSLGGFFESAREKAGYWAEDPDGRECLSVQGRTEAKKQLAQLKLIKSEQENAARATRISTAALLIAAASIVLNPVAARFLSYFWPEH